MPSAALRSVPSHRRVLLLSTAALLALTGCTSTVAGNAVMRGGTSSSSNQASSDQASTDQSGQSSSQQPQGTSDDVPVDADSSGLAAVLNLPADEQDKWLRRASMDFELKRGEDAGLVAAVGGQEQYAQILLDQAAWFDKQLGAPGVRQSAHALRDSDDINDPRTQVGLGDLFGAPAGGGQSAGENEWENGQRGEFTDPSNPKNSIDIDDNNVSSTVHLDPYDNAKVHTEITMKKDSEMCPDPKGKMRVVYTFEIESVSKVGGGNYHGSWIVGVTAQLDDDAKIVSTDTQFQYQNGGSAGAGEELSGFMPASGDPEVTKDGQGWGYVAAVSRYMQSKNITDALQKTIERGKCIKLNLSASDGPDGLDTDTEVTITSTPTAVMDGAPAKGTVKATLTGGTQSVSPEGEKQSANPSVTVTYKSPKGQDQTGTVSFEARSLRGTGKEQMTLSTGECIVGTWTMDNDSWNSIVGPAAAQAGGDMKATGGPIVTTFTKDGKFEFTFNGFTQDITVAQGKMTVVYTGKDTGTWKRTAQGTYTITGLKAGVHAQATADLAGQHMEIPMDYNAALQPGTNFTCNADVLSAQTPYGDVSSTRQGS